jgi:hypothetical protein
LTASKAVCIGGRFTQTCRGRMRNLQRSSGVELRNSTGPGSLRPGDACEGEPRDQWGEEPGTATVRGGGTPDGLPAAPPGGAQPGAPGFKRSRIGLDELGRAKSRFSMKVSCRILTCEVYVPPLDVLQASDWDRAWTQSTVWAIVLGLGLDKTMAGHRQQVSYAFCDGH